MPERRTRSDLEAISWPPIRLGDNAILAALLAELDASQWFPAEAVEAAQARQLSRLVAHHAAHSRHFARRLGAAGLRPEEVNNLEGLRRLPPMSRREVQSTGAAFFAERAPPSHLPVSAVTTSGSTGEPVTIRKTAVGGLTWSAFALRDHLWHGRDFGGRMTSIRASIHAYAEYQDWGKPVASLYESGPSQGIPILTDIAEQLRLIRQFSPAVLLTYPSNLNAFADLWERDGFEAGGLRHIRTLGETVSQALRDRVRRATGLGIEDSYSAHEVGPIAIQCPASENYHVMAEALIVEIVDASGQPCAEGEPGNVVVTDLINFASPIIRYRIGDIAERGPACPCGRGLPTLRRILGRERNLMKRADGTRHWPVIGPQNFEEAVRLRQFQFVQHSLSAIEFKAVTDEELTAAQAEALVAIARRIFGEEYEIRLTHSRARLLPPPHGKFEEFVCLA